VHVVTPGEQEGHDHASLPRRQTVDDLDDVRPVDVDIGLEHRHVGEPRRHGGDDRGDRPSPCGVTGAMGAHDEGGAHDGCTRARA
jgi:hypothetical protein